MEKKEFCGLRLLFASYRLYSILICFSPKPRKRKKKHSNFKRTLAICFDYVGDCMIN